MINEEKDSGSIISSSISDKTLTININPAATLTLDGDLRVTENIITGPGNNTIKITGNIHGDSIVVPYGSNLIIKSDSHSFVVLDRFFEIAGNVTLDNVDLTTNTTLGHGTIMTKNEGALAGVKYEERILLDKTHTSNDWYKYDFCKENGLDLLTFVGVDEDKKTALTSEEAIAIYKKIKNPSQKTNLIKKLMSDETDSMKHQIDIMSIVQKGKTEINTEDYSFINPCKMFSYLSAMFFSDTEKSRFPIEDMKKLSSEEIQSLLTKAQLQFYDLTKVRLVDLESDIALVDPNKIEESGFSLNSLLTVTESISNKEGVEIAGEEGSIF